MNEENEDRTDWHRLLGLMMTPLFEKLGCEVTVEVDLSLKKQFLDVVVVRKYTSVLFDDVNPDYYEGFENLNEHNLISFKSFREVFNMAALEELYGHFTNYKKIKNLKDGNNINLYAVTNHFPETLFNRFKDTKLIECIKKNKIYDLKVLTPVRFIITKDSNHPILGLFSNNIKQIIMSRERLQHDGWLLKYTSTYLNKLYDHYNLEGVDMPYTREMFVKDNYPEHYGQFLLGKQEGRQEGEQNGLQKGELTGK
ncbi:hypothetical protein, partial [Desulfamplus magnetovallimortis]|uniref:hypothetical protein n=1 Tax=Desulfamplus magnetovallimortis TaxID=1246637 RepID=UPI0009B9C0F7